MHKLNLSDIKIKKAGKQIEEIIIETYGSIEAFAKLIDRYPASISSYLRDKKCGSIKFKSTLSKMLNKSYDDIVKTNRQQIAEMVNTVSSNIKLYNDTKDKEVLEKLKDLCIKEGMERETTLMLLNIGIYYYTNGNGKVAIEFLKYAISTINNKEDSVDVVKILSELGLMYYLEHNYEKAKTTFEEAEQYSRSICIDNNTMFLLNYRIGILLNNTNMQKEARKRFDNALKYAENTTDIANATMNIGLTYKREYDYLKAIEIYIVALGIFKVNDFNNISRLYNNLAEAYRSMRDYDNALLYIEKALKSEKDADVKIMAVHVQTYIQIRIDMGETDNAVESLISLFKNSGKNYNDKKYIVSGISILTQYAVESGDMIILDKIRKLILTIISENRLQDCVLKELKICMGDISLAFIKGGGTIEE